MEIFKCPECCGEKLRLVTYNHYDGVYHFQCNVCHSIVEYDQEEMEVSDGE